MVFDLLTIGEALVEIMRTGIDQHLDQPGPFIGPYPSGAPFIFVVQAARLGMNAGGIGAVGADAFGRCFLNRLEADGVSTDGVQVLSGQATGIAFIAYHGDGSRSYVFSLGAGGQLSPHILDESLFEGLRCFHLTGSALAMNPAALQTGRKALEIAQAHGARFSFDPNLRSELMPLDEAREVFAPFVEAAHVLLPTAEELTAFTGLADVAGAAASLLEQKPGRIVVVSRGADGCSVYSELGTEHVPGFAVDEVDPTGAGDCFDAGFLSAWLQGDSLYEAARLANACGALAVTQQGPMAGAATLPAVREFMAKHT